jgi:hypothetical protein
MRMGGCHVVGCGVGGRDVMRLSLLVANRNTDLILLDSDPAQRDNCFLCLFPLIKNANDD